MRNTEDIQVDLNTMPRELQRPITEYLLGLYRATGRKGVTGVTYSGIVIKDVAVDAGPRRFTPDVANSDYHEADATGVPDTEVQFTEDDPFEDEESDWDPQF